MYSALHLIYFSPAYSTREVLRLFGAGKQIIEHDITHGLTEQLSFGSNDLVVLGIPVYAGRIPVAAAETLNLIKGQHTPAVAIAVYGNRDFDDALIELCDVAVSNGFIVIGAGAFIARHSIFPVVAENRPDDSDKIAIHAFAEKCMSIYHSKLYHNNAKPINAKGNRPYKDMPPKGPFFPTADGRCISCGICADECPVNAIPEHAPDQTIEDVCIRCTRCIVACPEYARAFRGDIYPVAYEKFREVNSARKEPEVFFCGE